MPILLKCKGEKKKHISHLLHIVNTYLILCSVLHPLPYYIQIINKNFFQIFLKNSLCTQHWRIFKYIEHACCTNSISLEQKTYDDVLTSANFKKYDFKAIVYFSKPQVFHLQNGLSDTWLTGYCEHWKECVDIMTVVNHQNISVIMGV